jgi:hypothetical protein
MPITPLLTATPGSPVTYNPSMADTYSWVPVEGAGRPLFARATYIANPSEITSGGFNIPAYDNVAITNDGSGNPTLFSYTLNGTAVATLSCTYNGSNYLTNVRQVL